MKYKSRYYLILFSLCCMLLSGCLSRQEDEKSASCCVGSMVERSEGSSGGEDLFVNGVVSLRDRSLNKLTANGVVNLDNVRLNELIVNGPVQASRLTVKESATINGPLQAKESRFDAITVGSSSIRLERSYAANITMKSSRSVERQVVTLVDTVIEGRIVFEQGNGTVEFKGSSVVKGGVVGGTQVHG